MRMYILIKHDVPDDLGPLIAAHASLAVYLKNADSELVTEWLEKSFKKAICTVNEKEFNTAKQISGAVVLTESALDGREVAIAFPPMSDSDRPKAFKYYRLWRAGGTESNT